MTKPIFYDPRQKRWTRLRVLFNLAGLAITGLILFFVVTTLQPEVLPRVFVREQKRKLRTLKEREHRKKPKVAGTHRKTGAPPSQVELNADEGIRAAYYVTWDAASFVSLQEYYPQIDILFPEWLHVLTPDGSLQSLDANNQLFQVIQDNKPRPVDDKVMPFLKAEKANVDVFPLINNFDPVRKLWISSAEFFKDANAR